MSTLQSIYDKDIDKANDESIYDIHPGANSAPQQQQQHVNHRKLQYLKKVLTLVILSVFGNLLNILINNIHDNHVILSNLINLKFSFFNLPEEVTFSIIGVFLGIYQPLMLKLFNLNLHLTKLSFSRILIIFLGLIFAIRKIQWDSVLQLSFLWSFLSILIYYLIDNSLKNLLLTLVSTLVLVVSILLSNTSATTITTNNELLIPVVIWLTNIIFLVILIFGLVGRHLFTH